MIARKSFKDSVNYCCSAGRFLCKSHSILLYTSAKNCFPNVGLPTGRGFLNDFVGDLFMCITMRTPDVNETDELGKRARGLA